MKYKDIKDFYQRCEEHPDHQSGMVTHNMIQHRLSDEIEELRNYIEQRTWVGLTHAEIDYQAKKDDHGVYFALGALWAEAKLKDKNYD